MEIPDKIGELIDKSHETIETPRAYLGASQLGHECDRYLWLSFRWAITEKFIGRMKRLFRRGHDEETNVISDLRRIGLKVIEQQKEFVDGHIKGHIDGIVMYQGKPHILEIKTHNDKNFTVLKKEGIPEKHEIQMQLYMQGFNIDRGLYFAINKNDDEIYTERIKPNDKAKKYLERGKRLTTADRMPPPISTNPSWYQCKFCSAHEFCHKSKITRNVNCRTCAHVTFTENGVRCERFSADIAEHHQRTGCRSHVIHPDLIHHEPKNATMWSVEYNGIRNGEDGIDSREMVVDGFFEKSVQIARKVFDATVLPEEND